MIVIYIFCWKISNDGLKAIKKSHVNKYLLLLPSQASNESRAECNYSYQSHSHYLSDFSYILRTLYRTVRSYCFSGKGTRHCAFENSHYNASQMIHFLALGIYVIITEE
jgi:hypothetical protein